MTLDEICGMSAEQLEKMTDQQLTDYFKQFFPLTRPEQVKRPTQSNGSQMSKPSIVLTPQKQAALQLLQDQGVDIGVFKFRKK
jgi:hypothetical protein